MGEQTLHRSRNSPARNFHEKMVKCHIYTSVFVNKMLIIELNCMFRQSGTTKPKTQIEANLQKAA